MLASTETRPQPRLYSFTTVVLSSFISAFCALLTIAISVLVLVLLCRSKCRSVGGSGRGSNRQIYEQVGGATAGNRNERSVAMSDPTYMEVGGEGAAGSYQLKENEAYGNTISLQTNEAYGDLMHKQ